MPDIQKVHEKEPLDEPSLNAVKREFDRRKKGTPYKGYKITDFVDSGSYAKVYKVENLFSGVVYAIRIAGEQGEKTQRELRAVRELMAQGEAHIVKYLMDFSVTTPYGTKHCALMEFLCPLSAHTDRRDDVELAVRCGYDLLPLLQTCMERKILHRDVKPGNILYRKDFRSGLLLGDFGEARTDVIVFVTLTGTPVTVAPEIAGYDDEISHTYQLCDMYSLGMVMYYYLNGRTYPFQNDYRQRLRCKDSLPEPLYGSQRLKALVVKATQYDPRNRFASPREMMKELRQCEEYRQFILYEVGDGEETLPVRDSVREENERLRRLLAQKEEEAQQRQAEIEALRQQAARRESEWQAQIQDLQQKAARRESQLRVVIKAQQQQAARRESELQAQVEDLRRKGSSPSPSDPEKTPSQPPVTPPVEDTLPVVSPRIAVKVGDRLLFGQYPQGADGEVRPLEWRVLAVKNGRALLVTDKLIDCVAYNELYNDVTWETCTLRQWMNRDFISKAFSGNQQARIATVTNQNPDNPEHGTKGGNATQDRIFALSIDEAKKYFRDDDDRMAALTEYAKKQGAYICDDKTAKKYGWKNSLPTGEKMGWWWLRSPGDSGGIAAGVVTRGFVLQCGGGVSFDSGAVRPAFWLNL